MLKVDNLSKNYGKNNVVKGIDFTIEHGEIAVLLGPNGAGKSTTIKSIAGLLKYKGNIEIDGHNNKSLKAKAVTGYVPEAPTIYELLTVKEHIEFITRAYSIENYEDRANRLLDIFDLTDKQDKLGKELSKGMMQKVSLCCAMIIRPKLLLLDEPMVGLDPKAIKEMKKYLIEMRDDGCAILISTHMIETVEELWDKVVVMKNGEIIASKLRKDMEENNEKLENIFFELTEG